MLAIDVRDDLVEILCAEDHLERRALRRRVQRDEPLGDQLLALLQVRLRDPQLVPVDLDLVLDARELVVREVDLLVGLGQARVELLHLGVDPLSLRLLRRRSSPGGGRECGDCGNERRKDPEQDVRHPPSSRSFNDVPSVGDQTGAPGGPVRHEPGRLAICSDTGNREVREGDARATANLVFAGLSCRPRLWYGPAPCSGRLIRRSRGCLVFLRLPVSSWSCPLSVGNP